MVCGRTAYGTDIVAAEEGEDREEDEEDVTRDWGLWGSLGGSRRVNSAQSVETEEALGLMIEDVDTFSNDSSRLIESCSRSFAAPA